MFRKEIPLTVTFLAGAVIMLGFFFNIPFLKTTAASSVLNWAVIIAAFALALGAGNLTGYHLRNFSRRGVNWPLSIMLITCLWGYFLYGVLRGPTDGRYLYLFDALLVPSSSTIFSLNAFYIISAAYRALRIRNPLSGLMVVTAFLVTLGRVGIGQVIWASSGPVSDWIMSFPNAAGQKGIVISTALGVMALGLRVVTGIERGYFGAE